MKLSASSLAFFPGGDLLAIAEDGLYRLDGEAKRVLAKRAGSSPAAAIGPDGRLFLAEGSKVFEADAQTLAPGKRVAFPADRGASGALTELAVSPDGKVLAGLTRGGTLHLQKLDGSAAESHPAYGARRQFLGFVGPGEVMSVRGNTLIEVRSLGGSCREVSGTFAVAGPGRIAAWALGGAVQVIDTASMKVRARLAVPEDDDGLQPCFVAGGAQVLVSSGKKLTLFDAAKGKVLKATKLASPAVMAATNDRVAVCVDQAIAVLSLPSLEVLAGKAPAPRPAKVPPAPRKPQPPPRKTKARPSPHRSRLERFVASLGDQVETAELGGSPTEAELKAVEKKLGRRLPADFRALWRDVDGFSISWGRGGGAIGMNSLAQLLDVPSEDQLWNDQYDEQCEEGGVPLGKLKKLRVLYSLPGEPAAVGIDLSGKRARLFFGEPNDVQPIALSLAQYLDHVLEARTMHPPA